MVVGTGIEHGRRLRVVVPPERYAERLARGELFARAGHLVQPDRRLSQLVPARPAGITTHQWNSATRTHFHFVVCDRHDGVPRLGVRFDDDDARPVADAERTIRMAHTVCAAVGLPVVRIESPALRPAAHGRRIVEYLLDARAFHEATRDGGGAPDGDTDQPPGFRDIVGRLPDGRSGYVNDLGAVARGLAVEAYVARRLSDPIIRGLHVEWSSGMAEGWAWLDAGAGRCLFERVRLWFQDFSCGVAPGRLAEDLAAMAIGERLKILATTEPIRDARESIRHERESVRRAGESVRRAGESVRRAGESARDEREPIRYDRARLAEELDRIRARRDEMRTPFAFDHVSFD